MRGTFPDTLHVEALDKRHDKDAFICGVEALDRYLRQQAGQDVRRHVASVFVATEGDRAAVLGYYTLSMASVRLDRLPLDQARRLPRYPTVPAVRLGRLAVHRDAHGQGLGEHLLLDAMARALANDLAWVAFLVEAKDARVRAFYQRFGFLSFADDPLHLYLPRGTVAPLLDA